MRCANAKFENKNRTFIPLVICSSTCKRINLYNNCKYFSSIARNNTKSVESNDQVNHNKVLNRGKKRANTRSISWPGIKLNANAAADTLRLDILNLQLHSDKADNVRSIHALLPNYDGFRKCLIKSSLSDITYQNNTVLKVLDMCIEQIKTKRDNDHVKVMVDNIHTIISTILDNSNQAKFVDAIIMLKSNTAILFLLHVTNISLSIEQTKLIINMVISSENKKSGPGIYNSNSNNRKSLIGKDDVVLNYLKSLRFNNIKMDKIQNNFKSILTFDVLTLNLVIATCINKGVFEEAMQWYFCMTEIFKIRPDEFTYQILLSRSMTLESLDAFFYLLNNLKLRNVDNIEKDNKLNVTPIYENILKLCSIKQPITRQFMVAQRVILDSITFKYLDFGNFNKLLGLALPIYLNAGKANEIMKLNSITAVRHNNNLASYYQNIALSSLSMKKHDLFMQCFNQICKSKSFDNIKEINIENADEISLYIKNVLDTNSNLLVTNGDLIGLVTIWFLNNSKQASFIESLWENLQDSANVTQSNDSFSTGLTCILNYFNAYASSSVESKFAIVGLETIENISLLCDKLIRQNTILSLKNAELLINLHRIFNNCHGVIKVLRNVYSQAAENSDFKNLSVGAFTKACHVLVSNGKYKETLEFFSIYIQFSNTNAYADYKLLSPILKALQELNDIDSMVQLVSCDMEKVFKLKPTEGHVYRVIETLRQNKRYEEAVHFFSKFNKQYKTRKLISVVMQCCAEGQLGEMLFKTSTNRSSSTLLNEVIDVIGNSNNIVGHDSNYNYNPSSWGALNNKLIVNIMLSLAGTSIPFIQ